MYRNISLSLLVLMFISGCATKWYHSSILDEDELSKKLVIDEGGYLHQHHQFHKLHTVMLNQKHQMYL